MKELFESYDTGNAAADEEKPTFSDLGKPRAKIFVVFQLPIIYLKTVFRIRFILIWIRIRGDPLPGIVDPDPT